MGNKQELERHVEYLPPTDEAISAFARSVCKQLAENGDPTYTSLEVVNGLGDFLKLAGRIQAKYLNRAQGVDTKNK